MSETMVSSSNKPTSDEWKDFDFSTVKVEKPRATRALSGREVAYSVIVGFVSGAAVWLSRLAIEAWAINPLFCRTPDTASICANAGSTSFITSLVIVGVIAASILVSARVFRSLLISLASFISIAALWPILSGRDAIVATIIAAAFGATLYLFFSMIAAVKRYPLAVVLMTVLVVGFWLIVNA